MGHSTAAAGRAGAVTRAYRRIDAFVVRRHHPARNIQIRALLDTFFVSSIATILIIRLQLWATHYPKLGGGKLHVAHLLWGGLAMLIAIVVLLSFLGQGRRHTAAILGGIGFGFFIDEIGKFVTSDNDYFFKPAAGMIYIVFILLFLAIRMLGWRHRWSPHECLTNAMEMLATARLRPLSVRERQLIGELLARSDPHDPLVAPLSTLLHELGSTPPRPPGPLARFANRLRNTYYRVAEQPGFALALVVVFGAVALVTVAQVVLDARRIFGGTESLHVIGAAGLASSLVAAGMIWIGIVHLRGSRIDAYRWFDHALLVQVFFTEVFAFLQHQFGAVFGLLLNLALLLALRTMIHAECHLSLLSQDPLEPLSREDTLEPAQPAAHPA